MLFTFLQKLGHFQTNLGDISKEIRELQGKSLQGNTKLRNRKHVESHADTAPTYEWQGSSKASE